MDIFYYSNYCKHCQKIIQYVIKQGYVDKISAICIDQRKRDHNNNQTFVILENGNQVFLPPNLQSVPSVLCVKKNYTLVTGVDPILQYFQEKFAPQIQNQPHLGLMGALNLDNPHMANPGRPQEKDPIGYDVMTAGPGIVTSESFTSYYLEHEDLKGDSSSANRPLYNYTPVNANFVIPTPPDTYRPDKISSNVTIDVLESQRNQEVPVVQPGPPQGLYGPTANNNNMMQTQQQPMMQQQPNLMQSQPQYNMQQQFVPPPSFATLSSL